MNSAWRAGAALLGLALLAGCATKPQGTVVLLPEQDGRDTAVLVKQDGGELLLVAAGTTLGHEKLLLFDRHRSLRVLAFLAKNVFLNKSNKIWLSIAALL